MPATRSGIIPRSASLRFVLDVNNIVFLITSHVSTTPDELAALFLQRISHFKSRSISTFDGFLLRGSCWLSMGFQACVTQYRYVQTSLHIWVETCQSRDTVWSGRTLSSRTPSTRIFAQCWGGRLSYADYYLS